MTEPRFDPTASSPDPGGCMPGCVFLKTALFVKWPQHRGDAGCYLHNGKTDSGRPSFHSRGRAIDIWIATGHLDVGTQMFDWCHANRNEIGLNEVIFNSRIWRADNLRAGIHAYTANRHQDHIHIALNLDGARAQLPWFRSGFQVGPTAAEIALIAKWLEDHEMDATQAGQLKDVHTVDMDSKDPNTNRPMVLTLNKRMTALESKVDRLIAKLGA